MQHIHDLQTLRERLRTMPARLTLHIGPYEVSLQGGTDPIIQQFAAEFVEDLATIVDVRIADLKNESSHAHERHSTSDMGDGIVGGPAR